MHSDKPVGHVALDREDRAAILQLLTLTADERLDYFVDEVEFVEATRPVGSVDD